MTESVKELFNNDCADCVPHEHVLYCAAGTFVGLEKGHFVLPLALPVSLTNRKQFLSLKPTSKGIISNGGKNQEKINKVVASNNLKHMQLINIHAKKFPGIHNIQYMRITSLTRIQCKNAPKLVNNINPIFDIVLN